MCAEVIEQKLGNISTYIEEEQKSIREKVEIEKKELINNRLQNIEKKRKELKESSDLMMKKQRISGNTFEEEDVHIEKLAKEESEKEAKTKGEVDKFNAIIGLEEGTSQHMYLDKFSNTEKPIPKNPDMDIIYMANNKGVDVTKLDREQKKKLLEFTTKERNFKYKADNKEELVNQMMSHDKETIQSAINGQPEPILPLEIKQARFTDPTASMQEQQQQPVSADGSQQQPLQTASVQEQQPLQTASADGSQQQQPPLQPVSADGSPQQGEKTIVTNIEPSGKVTVTTKVLKDQDEKDFIVNAKTDFKGQNGIDTMINLGKKLNRETQFVNNS
tara:strand:- start:1120 stop:2115 length:996 start_codon:yes stop_codon:yes gene_type:complete